MQLRVFRSLWGYPGAASDAVDAIAASDYDGVEVELPRPGAVRDALIESVRATDLGVIPLIALEDQTPAGQLREFQRWIGEVDDLELPLAVMHSGRDYWPADEKVSFYREATAIERESGAAVAHETHRQRALSTPWETAAILNQVPSLGLCCDFSHWLLVCERIPEDQADWFARAAERCLHLHARQGSDQAPQVATPGDPAQAEFQAAFERWWEMVWEAQETRGFAISTATPEYGPPPYQPIIREGADLEADLDAACRWQTSRLRCLFEARATLVR
jgi:sugar phosphate isomerase/epimerase